MVVSSIVTLRGEKGYRKALMLRKEGEMRPVYAFDLGPAPKPRLPGGKKKKRKKEAK